MGERRTVLQILNLSLLLTPATSIAVWAQDAAKKPATASQVDRLVSAAFTGDVDGVKKALETGAPLDGRGKTGLTAWQAAKLKGQTEAIAFLASKGADAKTEWPKPENLADGMISTFTKGTTPAVAVLASKNGTILFQNAYGFANLEHKVPATVETKFRIGSISKQFTAAAILKLVEDGKLKLDDPLTKFVPGFPKGEKVTIHHLLTHTSGIHSYTGRPDFMKNVRNAIKPDDLVKLIQTDPYDFDPGQRWMYNNSGYFLLGYIVEKLSGKSYADFLKTTFFEPLEMKATGVHTASDILEHEAHGYANVNGKLQKAENWDMTWAGGAGALYSTVGDLHRWNEGVFGGKVLKEPTLKSAFTAALVATDPKDKPKEDGYGYGWGMSKTRGLREIGHGGGLHGFNSYLLRLPNEKLTVAVLINALPPTPGLDASSIAHEVANIYCWEKMEARPVYAAKTGVTAKQLGAYVGSYDYGAAVMAVTLKGDQLFAQLTGQPNFEIYPRAENEFFWKVVDAQVTFVKDAKGNVTKAIHKQGGSTIDAPRIPNLVAIKVDPKILATYVGKYSLLGGTWEVTLDGDRMFTQLTGQPKFELFAKSETEYFLKVVHAQAKFVKDKDGKVVKALIEQGGQKFEAPRNPD